MKKAIPEAYLVGLHRAVKDSEALAAYAKLGGPAVEAALAQYNSDAYRLALEAPSLSGTLSTQFILATPFLKATP